MKIFHRLLKSNSYKSIGLFTRRRILNNHLSTYNYPKTFFSTYTIVNTQINKKFDQMTVLSELLSKLEIKDYEPFPGTDPIRNPSDFFRSKISKKLSEISGIDQKLIVPALERVATTDRGDFVLPIPRILRGKGINHAQVAEEWASKFPTEGYLEKVTAKGSFIQFFFSPSALFDLVLKDILVRKEDYGKSEIGKGKKVIVEFSSPNIAKPFHAGHLRSTIIGGFLANLYEVVGWDVKRINYLGDWGKQFGILAVGFDKYGSEEKLKADPINHLFEVYVKINKDIEAENEQLKIELAGDVKEAGDLSVLGKTNEAAKEFFKEMEDGDEKSLSVWKRFRELSIGKYVKTYGRLNITYDVYSGESQVSKESMLKALKDLDEKGLIQEDKGAKIVDLKPFNKKLNKVIIQKSDGTTLYITRDIGEAVQRYEKYKFDKMIYVVAAQQDLHFGQFFKILELLGYEWAKNLQHVNFGMVQGMSTRKGTVVFLDNILEETKEAMHDVMKKNEGKYAQIENPDEVADLVGISAVMIQDMQAKRINNYSFNWSRMLSFEGDTGPYLQYAHSRLRSVERNAGFEYDSLLNADFSLLKEPVAESLIRILSQYPDVILTALKTNEPATIVTYLFKLAHTVSSCYDILWVSGQPKELATARLALYSASRQVLFNGMTLLNLTPVERM